MAHDLQRPYTGCPHHGRSSQWRSNKPACIGLALTATLLSWAAAPKNVYAVGATVPFTSYEAEAGAVGGGASVVALTTAPNTQFSSPALEASGHAYVQLTGAGQYVQW